MTRTALGPALLGVAVVYAASAVIAQMAIAQHPAIAMGIAFDLTVTSAAVFWWLAVRPGKASRKALVRVVALGFVAAKLLVGLSALGAVGAAAEVGVLALLVVRVRRIVRRTRVERAAGHGLPAALEIAFAAVLPARAVASALATEVAVMILAVTGWFRRAPAGYAMHRTNAYVTVIGVLGFLAVVETVILHVVLAHYAPTLAIVSTVLSIYSVAWLIGEAHAARLSPLRVIGDDLVIERGAIRRAIVPRAVIASATAIDGKVDGAVDLSLLGPNVLLELREPVIVHGMFGRQRRADKIMLSVDDRDAVLALLQ